MTPAFGPRNSPYGLAALRVTVWPLDRATAVFAVPRWSARRAESWCPVVAPLVAVRVTIGAPGWA